MSILKDLVYVHGIRIISVSEGIDTDQQGWELAAQILLMFHEKYIEQLAQDVLRGQEGNVLNGRAVGDHRFGYTTEEMPGSQPRGKGKKKPRQYKINPAEAKWVVRIFEMFVAEKLSLTQIVKELNANNAPKDHRSSVEAWSHGNVVSILESVKYIGLWPWGALRNCRDPHTGRVWQEPRSEDEISDGWMRVRPDLQIVDVPLFKAAQDRLEENRDKIAEYRDEKGKFSGGRGSRGNPPQHLCSGLLFCSECNHKFYIGGANGNRMFCPNYRRGTCSCKTTVRKDLATKLILKFVTDLISKDEAWLEHTFRSAFKAWKSRTESVPGEIVAKEKELSALDRKIERLISRIENGNPEVLLDQRLAKRRVERQRVASSITELHRSRETKEEPPTREWVKDQLNSLVGDGEVMTPATIEAIQALLGGRIEVSEVQPTVGKKKHLRGRLKLGVSNATRLVLGYSGSAENVEETSVELDFKEAHPLYERSEIAKGLYDQGLMNTEIKEIMGISKSMVTKLIRFWFESRGLEMPDGRARRSTLKKKHTEQPYYQQISDRVKELMDEELLLYEIADRIGCDRNTVTSAARYWYESRGLPYPDGRERRKSLNCNPEDPGS